MSKAKIEEKLEMIQKQKTFDEGFLAILSESNADEDSADVTTKKVIEEIGKRYAKDKEN